MESVILRDTKTMVESEKRIDGVFIYVGISPNTSIVEVDKNEGWFHIDQ